MLVGGPHPPRSLQSDTELPGCLLCSSHAAGCFASGCDMALSSRVGTPGGHRGMLKKTSPGVWMHTPVCALSNEKSLSYMVTASVDTF